MRQIVMRSIVVVLACLALPGCKKASKPVTVGVLIPLTGGAASYGQNSRRGAELALQQVRAEHPELRVELRVEDSRGEAAVGTRALTKLLDLDQVIAVVGCVTSGVTMAAAPIMNQRKVPIVSTGGSSPNLTTAGEYVFRTWPSDVFEAEAIVPQIVNRGVRKLALLHINNEYGRGMAKAVQARLSKGPVAVVHAETFEQGAREMRTQLLKLKDAGADGIYFVGFPEAAVVFGKAYAEQGLKLPVFATSAFEDPQVPRDTGGALDGTVYSKPQASSSRVAAFKAAYQAAYKLEPGVTSDTAYDAARLVLEAIAEASREGHPPTGTFIHDRLLKVKDYQGASGTLSFDANGDVVKPVEMFVLRGGRYEKLAR